RWARPASWVLLLAAFQEGAALCVMPVMLLLAALPLIQSGLGLLAALPFLRSGVMLEFIIGVATFACYGLLVGFVWPTPMIHGRPAIGALLLRCGLFVLLAWSVGVYVFVSSSAR